MAGLSRRGVLSVSAASSAAAIFAPFPAAAFRRDNGRYVGPLQLELSPGNRTAKLLAPFGYIDPAGQRWQVPTGAIVDGASIPRILWGPVGGPWDGLYRQASVIHDFYCDVRQRTWQATHRVFYDAMKTSQVAPIQANYMYFAVRKFGPRWSRTTVENSIIALSRSNFSSLLSPSLQLNSASQSAFSNSFRNARDSALAAFPDTPGVIGDGLALRNSFSATALTGSERLTFDFVPQDDQVEVIAEQALALDPEAIADFASRPDLADLTAAQIETIADDL